MIEYNTYKLPNNLSIIICPQEKALLTTVSIIYKAGSVHENIPKTGLAHLLEHLMFRGSFRYNQYDLAIQKIGGFANALTTCNYTNYYISLNTNYIAELLKIEADRMHNLMLRKRDIQVEKQIIKEEYKQYFCNQPYGDIWINLRKQIFGNNTYGWMPIGQTPDHLDNISVNDIQTFYQSYYQPNNAIITIVSNANPLLIEEQCNNILGRLKNNNKISPHCTKCLSSEKPSTVILERTVPYNTIIFAFKIGSRSEREYYICDFISELLANNNHSYLKQKLCNEKKVFINVEIQISDTLEQNIFVVICHLSDRINIDDAENLFWEEIDNYIYRHIVKTEQNRILNNIETENQLLSENDSQRLAIDLSLCYFCDNVNLINEENSIYSSITIEEIYLTSKKLFEKNNCYTLIYKKERNEYK